MIQSRSDLGLRGRKIKSAGLALFALGALCVLWGAMGAPAASAVAVCADSTESVGNYENISGGQCINHSIFRTKLLVIVESISVVKIAAGVGCAKVTETNEGNYKNSTCTEKVESGTGSFVKVKIKEGGPKWTVGGKDAKELSAGVAITKLTSAKATLKAKIGGAEVKFNTEKTPELIGVKLEGAGKLATGGKVKFTGVTTELNGKASAVCKPLGTSGSDATLEVITTEKGKGELTLHEGLGVTQIIPETGNVFGKLFFGEECSLPAEVPVITKKTEGKGLVLKDPLGTGSELLEHEITELAALTELWVISETAEHKTIVEGKAAIGLTSPHNTLKWFGTPKEFEISL